MLILDSIYNPNRISFPTFPFSTCNILMPVKFLEVLHMSRSVRDDALAGLSWTYSSAWHDHTWAWPRAGLIKLVAHLATVHLSLKNTHPRWRNSKPDIILQLLMKIPITPNMSPLTHHSANKLSAVSNTALPVKHAYGWSNASTRRNPGHPRFSCAYSTPKSRSMCGAGVACSMLVVLNRWPASSWRPHRSSAGTICALMAARKASLAHSFRSLHALESSQISTDGEYKITGCDLW